MRPFALKRMKTWENKSETAVVWWDCLVGAPDAASSSVGEPSACGCLSLLHIMHLYISACLGFARMLAHHKATGAAEDKSAWVNCTSTSMKHVAWAVWSAGLFKWLNLWYLDCSTRTETNTLRCVLGAFLSMIWGVTQLKGLGSKLIVRLTWLCYT